jgi:hypothetical protein
MIPELTVGLPAESGFLVLLLRVIAGSCGVFLLLLGRRFERLSVGVFFLAAGLLAGWAFLPSYGADVVVALAVFAAGTLVDAFAHRLAVALSLPWLFPAVLGGYLVYTGSLDPHYLVAITLMVVGFLGALLLPGAATAALSAGLGALLLEAAFSFEVDYPLIMAIVLSSAAWQAFFLPVPASAAMEKEKEKEKLSTPVVRARAKAWLRGVGRTAALLVAGVLGLVLLAPEIPVQPGSAGARLEKLKASGGLEGPGLLFSAEDSFYLGGRAFPLALVSERPGLAARLSLPFMGRNPRAAVHKMRAVKEAGELDKMRRAAQITSQAFADIQPLIRPGASEKEIEKAILASFRKNGATGLAFECIVASGPNAVDPHYMRNAAVMKRGLVVIDIGCSVENYASDMTRTFPVSGSWSPEERRLVETVVAAGEAARATLKAGVTMSVADRAAKDVIEKAGFGEYVIHFVGHAVGLDVHDPEVKVLEPGAVVTIEPGIYIPAGSKAEKAYWDLGVRVEDSYLITPDGCEALTNFPKIPGE